MGLNFKRNFTTISFCACPISFVFVFVFIKMSDDFVEHPKSKDDSSVWRYFLTNKDRNKGKCLQCFRIIRADGSSTSALHSHMKNIHKVNTLKRHLDVASPSPSTSKITDFYGKSDNESLDEVISRMAALDGISFQLFCTSEDIRKGLIARGFKDVPKSPNTIRKYVLDFAERIRNKTISRFNQMKLKGHKFSASSDEWTSLRNRRFINVNVHSTNETFNLGLGRAYGKLPAEKVCLSLIPLKCIAFIELLNFVHYFIRIS